MATGNISGKVWDDLNANGVWDVGEPALEGWYVFVDYDDSGTIAMGEPTAITNSNGAYTLEDISADTVD